LGGAIQNPYFASSETVLFAFKNPGKPFFLKTKNPRVFQPRDFDAEREGLTIFICCSLKAI